MWTSTICDVTLCLSFNPTLGTDTDSEFQDRNAVAREEHNVLIDRLKFGLIFWHDLRNGYRFHGWI
jgi:hypothetical protein